jgi:nucleotide-binding universal stress UspA family protein
MAAAFRRVLVGFDGSPDAAEALRVATSIAGRDGGHVVALSVLRPAPGHEGDREPGSESNALRRMAEACFEEFRRGPSQPRGVRMSVQVVFSDRESAGQVVSNYAAEHGFDILVLGRHGDGAHLRSRLGRVADRAAQTCSVPVLLLSAP